MLARPAGPLLEPGQYLSRDYCFALIRSCSIWSAVGDDLGVGGIGALRHLQFSNLSTSTLKIAGQNLLYSLLYSVVVTKGGAKGSAAGSTR